MRITAIAGLVLAGASVAGCGGGASETKVGGAWPALPVTCSAYERGTQDYEDCLERDRAASVPVSTVPAEASAAASDRRQTGVRSAR